MSEQKIEDIEVVEEAMDTSLPDEEKKSVDSVDKASDVTKKAPKRKGDKDAKDEPAPQGNVKMKEDSDQDEEIIEEDTFEDDLNALVESEATLSESFREKAGVIFEAALKSKVALQVNRLEEQYTEQLTEAKEEIKTDLVEKVDSYLNYVVEQWMEDNKVAVEKGLRTEIAEGFMSALKDVFVENYIQVPEAKVDLVDQLAEQVSDLEEKLNKSEKSNIELSESLAVSKRDSIISEASKGLTVTQADKLATLAENIDFENAETFTQKVETIKASYFPAEKVVVTEETAEEVTDSNDEVSSPSMNAYINAIKHTLK
ncbi:MAG: hypothetical protein CBB72_016415 [Muricauda sp. TMED12]|nr:MAG: hypothetical protein CBB72_016415 [Muricauda sp. TMED12]